MRHANALDIAQAVLVVVDLQDAFRPAIFEFEKIVARTAIMIEAAKLLSLPMLVTEQVPAKLGQTVDEVKRALPASVTPLGKTAFSACGAAGFVEALKSLNRRQIILCGIESHVCMNQTAHDLLSMGHQVHVVEDCTSSRTPANRQVGLDKMMRGGALPSSCEMALFELMIDARHEQFRAISKLIK